MFFIVKYPAGKITISLIYEGAVFNIANLLIVVAINIAGMAVAFPIGIGLALVKRIISDHNGALEIKKLATGGTEATVTLPL